MIECITTCVNYADFLAETLPRDLMIFDRVTVITSNADRETQELCRKLSTPYYCTDLFFKDGSWNKARGIDFGLGYLRWNEWVVHKDADTFLPQCTRQWLENKDDTYIYGIDRVECVGYSRWKAYREHPGHDYMCRVKIPPFPLLDRIAIKDYGGYVPIGFFQMWHGRHNRRYPIAKGDAEHTDVLHAIQWERRALIPEIIGIHLQSEPAKLGANWKGRKTVRFGPDNHGEVPADAKIYLG